MNRYILIIILLISATIGLISQEKYQVDQKSSTLKWEGTKGHVVQWGYAPIKKGYISVDKDKFIQGEITVDMKSINVQSMKSEKSRERLTAHLKSKDFFCVVLHPFAFFRISKSLHNSLALNGEANYTFSGELTIKGITHSITFPAFVQMIGDTITVKAKCIFARSQYNVEYGLKSMFAGLGNSLISDDVPLNIDISAILMK